MTDIEKPSCSISQFTTTTDGENLAEDLGLVKVNRFNLQKVQLAVEDQLITRNRNGIFVMLYVTGGDISVTLDYKRYTLKECNIFSIADSGIFTDYTANSSFEGYILLVSVRYLKETFLEKVPFYIWLLSSSPSAYNTNIDYTDFNILKHALESIRTHLKRQDHHFRKELVRNSFSSLIYEGANIHLDNNDTTEQIKINRNTDTFAQRFFELIVTHGDREHNPSFYADKLCISVQYLSILLKRFSGKTAGSLIAEYLVNRAKVLLRKPNYTIQQITYILNFSDQSAFGKFFKKHTGMTPKEYREENSLFL